MTITTEQLKEQYNRLLGQIIDLEENGKSADNSKYKMLCAQASQLFESIASSESVFDIRDWADSVAFYAEKGEKYVFLYGFTINNLRYPLLRSENLRKKWGL